MTGTIQDFFEKVYGLKYELCVIHHDFGPALGGMDFTKDTKGRRYVHFKFELKSERPVTYVVKLDDIISATDIRQLAKTVHDRKDTAKEERLEELKRKHGTLYFTKTMLDDSASDIESGITLEKLKKKIADTVQSMNDTDAEIKRLETELGIESTTTV